MNTGVIIVLLISLLGSVDARASMGIEEQGYERDHHPTSNSISLLAALAPGFSACVANSPGGDAMFASRSCCSKEQIWPGMPPGRPQVQCCACSITPRTPQFRAGGGAIASLSGGGADASYILSSALVSGGYHGLEFMIPYDPNMAVEGATYKIGVTTFDTEPPPGVAFSGERDFMGVQIVGGTSEKAGWRYLSISRGGYGSSGTIPFTFNEWHELGILMTQSDGLMGSTTFIDGNWAGGGGSRGSLPYQLRQEVSVWAPCDTVDQPEKWKDAEIYVRSLRYVPEATGYPGVADPCDGTPPPRIPPPRTNASCRYNPNCELRITVNAFIDHEDALYISHGSLYWHHISNSKPGRWTSGGGSPIDAYGVGIQVRNTCSDRDPVTSVTVIDQPDFCEWCPTWVRDGESAPSLSSLLYLSVVPRLFVGGVTVEPTPGNAPFTSCSGAQPPEYIDVHSVKIPFKDDCGSGARWHSADITFKANDCNYPVGIGLESPVECNGRGTRGTDGSCTCDGPFRPSGTGADACSTWGCSGGMADTTSACCGNGVCAVPYVCSCDIGYTRYGDCSSSSQSPTYSYSDPSVCRRAIPHDFAGKQVPRCNYEGGPYRPRITNGGGDGDGDGGEGGGNKTREDNTDVKSTTWVYVVAGTTSGVVVLGLCVLIVLVVVIVASRAKKKKEATNIELNAEAPTTSLGTTAIQPGVGKDGTPIGYVQPTGEIEVDSMEPPPFGYPSIMAKDIASVDDNVGTQPQSQSKSGVPKKKNSTTKVGIRVLDDGHYDPDEDEEVGLWFPLERGKYDLIVWNRVTGGTIEYGAKTIRIAEIRELLILSEEGTSQNIVECHMTYERRKRTRQLVLFMQEEIADSLSWIIGEDGQEVASPGDASTDEDGDVDRSG